MVTSGYKIGFRWKSPELIALLTYLHNRVIRLPKFSIAKSSATAFKTYAVHRHFLHSLPTPNCQCLEQTSISATLLGKEDKKQFFYLFEL